MSAPSGPPMPSVPLHQRRQQWRRKQWSHEVHAARRVSARLDIQCGTAPGGRRPFGDELPGVDFEAFDALMRCALCALEEAPVVDYWAPMALGMPERRALGVQGARRLLSGAGG
jgi:hypothetical protein